MRIPTSGVGRSRRAEDGAARIDAGASIRTHPLGRMPVFLATAWASPGGDVPAGLFGTRLHGVPKSRTPHGLMWASSRFGDSRWDASLRGVPMALGTARGEPTRRLSLKLLLIAELFPGLALQLLLFAELRYNFKSHLIANRRKKDEAKSFFINQKGRKGSA